jgi:hypothetical protein
MKKVMKFLLALMVIAIAWVLFCGIINFIFQVQAYNLIDKDYQKISYGYDLLSQSTEASMKNETLKVKSLNKEINSNQEIINNMSYLINQKTLKADFWANLASLNLLK